MAYFEENEQILYLSTNPIEKQTIEDGINRSLTSVRTVTGLVEEIERDMKRQGRVNVIVTESMGEQFKARLEDIAGALNTFAGTGMLVIIEIGIGKVFKDALTFSDILTFVEYVRRERRHVHIDRLVDEGGESEKEGFLMRELMVEVESYRERVEVLQNKIETKEEEILQVKAEYQALETKVEHVYEIKMANLEKELENLKEELSETTRLLRVEKEKVKEYEEEVNELRSDNKSLELEKESLTVLNNQRRQDVKSKESEIKTLNNTIEKLQDEKTNILMTRVDAEAHVILSKELDESRREYVEMQKKYEDMRIESMVKGHQISDLQTDIAELRKGEFDVQEFGRTTKLDTVKFEMTNVYYIKVITELPYLMSAVKEFYENIKEISPGRSHVMILRNDEGIDNMFYSGIELYGTLGDVRSEDEVFKLYPTRRMFSGAEYFDGKVKNLLVLDFIRSNDYYIETDSVSKYITVVRDSSMIRKYSLKGTAVSLDAGSQYDIRHDDKIEMAVVQNIRKGMIKGKVQRWMRNIGIL